MKIPKFIDFFVNEWYDLCNDEMGIYFCDRWMDTLSDKQRKKISSKSKIRVYISLRPKIGYKKLELSKGFEDKVYFFHEVSGEFTSCTSKNLVKLFGEQRFERELGFDVYFKMVRLKTRS